MTTPDVDPFAEDPIQRDQWGRPKIIPLNRRKKPDLKAELVGYTRASTFCGLISDPGGLTKWRLWHLALGLGRNPDLAQLAGVYGPTVDDLSRQDKRELDEVIERAHDRSGGNAKADYGTAVHALTEPDSFGTFNDPSIHADVASYLAALERYGLEVVDSEQFIVNDDVQVAGTYDHRLRTTRPLMIGAVPGIQDGHGIPAGVVLVTDKKTGKLHFDSQCIQLAVYANGAHYDPETGERTEFEASKEWGILAHIPKGEGKTDLYLIDLQAGYAAARLARQVDEHRKRKDIGHAFPVEPVVGTSLTANTDALAKAQAEQAAYFDAVAKARAEAAELADKLAASRAAIDAENAAAKTLDTPTDTPVLQPVKPDPYMGGGETPATTAPPTEAEALNTLSETLGAEVILTVEDKLRGAASKDELAAVWREHRTEWTDALTALLRKRAAEVEQAA